MQDTKTIAICNQKGGVGKTTTTVNLGIGLGMEGKRVLLVDLDPQADLTSSLGWKNTDDIDCTIANLMAKTMRDEKILPGEGILHHKEGVDLVPSNLTLSGLEMNLNSAMSREVILKDYLSRVKNNYDYVLIDCMPSLGMITVNALSAADSVLIPVQAQYLPAKGMMQLMKMLESVKRHTNPGIKIEGIAMTLVDNRTNLARDTINILRRSYGNRVNIFDSQIPIAVKAAEVSAKGESIYSFDKNNPVSKAYANLTKEVLRDGEKQKDRVRSSDAR